MPVFAFTAGSFGDILATAGLAAQLAKTLYDNRSAVKEFEPLVKELQSLQGTLVLIDYALQRCSSTPLGEVLIHYIGPDITQCHLSLHEFLQRVNACEHAFSFTSISALWRRVIWVASDETAALSTKLSNFRLKLVVLLVSLHSYLETGSPHLTQTNSYLTKGRSPLHIKDQTIDVLDPLGSTIPIPILFCGSWQSFHYVLMGYFKDRVGQSYIEQGDYQIIRPKTQQVIDQSTFIRDVKEGDTLEMSIIMRPGIWAEDKTTCPRCSKANSTSTNLGGWIQCTHCSGLFKIQTIQTEKDNIQQGRISEALNGSPTNKIHCNRYTRSSTCKQDNQSEARFFRRITLAVETYVHDVHNTNTGDAQASGIPRVPSLYNYRLFLMNLCQIHGLHPTYLESYVSRGVDQHVWKCFVSIKGALYGVGEGATKAAAKEAAAQTAFETLDQQIYSPSLLSYTAI